MPRSSKDDPSATAPPSGAVARTQLNHIVGYSVILKQDALEAGREDLAELFSTIAESALALKSPLSARLEEAPGGAPRGDILDHEIYGILYALIALVQNVKGKASSSGRKELSAEAERLLEAANAILELMAAAEDSPSGAVDEELNPVVPRTDLASTELAAAPRPGRILVVDDNLFNRELLSRHLERQGHSVRAAADGLAALELLRAESFDVAIIDVMMPGMNGYQLLERIRAEEALKGVHAIVISSLEDTQIIARCIQLGAEDYLPREFEPVILKARIESCLEKKRMKEEQELYVAALLDAQEKLSAELRGGAAYVRSLLPGRISVPGLSTDWEFIPSASLGGDVFGYHVLGGAGRGGGAGKLALYLIDVSGHGIEAALFSVTLMNMLKTQVLPGADFAEPASVLDRLGSSFRMEEQNNLLFTAWYGVWDHGTRELTYASAGSPPALLVLPDGSSTELSTDGMIVGVDADARYDAGRAAVPRGSGLYVFSDGVYEFRANDGSIFGLERFERLLTETACAPKDGGPVLGRLLESAKAECATERFPDDVSLLEVRFD
jgi:sigma-B regulation protein RsbU (phosphoserine phosphatase)